MRVTIPGRVWPAAVPQVRAFRPGDERAIHAAMLEVHALGELDGVTRHHLDAAADRLRLEPDGCAVGELDGHVAGWVVPGDDDLTVAPGFRRRGVGSVLVTAGRTIARRQGQAELRLWVSERPGPEAFARAVGLAYRSSLWRLRLADDARPGPAVFPDGIVVRPLDSAREEPAFVALVNEVFLDHPWPLRLTLDQVRRAHASPGFDPGSVAVAASAADPARLLGFCRVTTSPADDGTRTGEVRLVGVRREARGVGLGRALTTWGVERVRGEGAEQVVLAVEGQNTGALRLYDRLGFRPEVEWPHWTIPVGTEDPPG
jgi:mycothiol synthase